MQTIHDKKHLYYSQSLTKEGSDTQDRSSTIHKSPNLGRQRSYHPTMLPPSCFPALKNHKSISQITVHLHLLLLSPLLVCYSQEPGLLLRPPPSLRHPGQTPARGGDSLRNGLGEREREREKRKQQREEKGFLK